MTAPAPDRVIDAHVHLWLDPTRGYAWLADPQRARLRRPFTPDDLTAVLAGAPAQAAVLVEGGAGQEFELAQLLAMAASPAVAGVVGWVDLTWPDLAERLAGYRAGPGGRWLRGVRGHVSRDPDPDYLAAPAVQRGLRAVRDAGLAFDLVARTEQLDAAARVLRGLPDLTVVLTHLGYPPLTGSGADREQWRSRLQALAALPRTSAKVSGLVSAAPVSASDVRPFLDDALELFGPDRLMLGSDWPGCLVTTTYAGSWSLAATVLATLSPGERVAVNGATATRVYRLAG